MDFSAINVQEALLSLRGLVIQAGVLDHIRELYLLAVIFAIIGLTVMMIRASSGGAWSSLIAYLLVIMVLWGLVNSRTSVGMRLFLPPEQERLAASQGISQEMRLGKGVNTLFAYTAGLISRFEQVAVKIVGKAISPDSVIRNTGSLAQETISALMGMVENFDKIDSRLGKNVKTTLEKFLSSGYVGDVPGCLLVYKRALMVTKDDEQENSGVGPWTAALLRSVMPDIRDEVKPGFDKYRRTLSKYSKIKNIPEKFRDAALKCRDMPMTIQAGLYTGFQAFLKDEKRKGNLRDAVVEAFKKTFTGSKGLLALAAIEVVNQKRNILRREHPFMQPVGSAYTWFQKLFTAPVATVKMSQVIEFMPYARGIARTVLYAIFPFLLIMCFLPAGLRWLGIYYRMLFAISLWSVMDVIIIGLSDSMFNSFLSGAATIFGGDFSIEALVWAQGVASVAAPGVAYAMANLSNTGALNPSAVASGPGVVALVGRMIRSVAFNIR